MSNLIKNLLFAFGIAVVIWLGYTFLIKDSDSDGSLTQSKGAATEAAELETQQLLARLQELKSYDVKGELFNDPRFVSLMDFRSYLGEEPSGRNNPFEPLQ